jgi:hypothetical protein
MVALGLFFAASTFAAEIEMHRSGKMGSDEGQSQFPVEHSG